MSTGGGRRPGARRRRAPCRPRSRARRVLTVPPEREADHVADDGLAERRAVAAGVAVISIVGRPGASSRVVAQRLEPTSAAAESLRPRARGDDDAGRRQQRAPGRIEVVVVVVVGEQHRVDRREIGGGDRRAGELARAGAPAEVVRPAGRVEGRVGQQPPAVDFDQGRRAPDVGDADVRSRALPACRLTVQSNAKSATSSQPSCPG